MQPSRSAGMQILLAEDDTDIAELIKLHLTDAGMQLTHAAQGDKALELALSDSFDLMILDLRLPELDGLEICRQIRLKGPNLPIVMLTAKTTELDRVLGLELGADDYVTKPFSPAELTARVKAVLRRAGRSNKEPTEAEEMLQLGSLAINMPERMTHLDGEYVDLTAKEFDLLAHFARHPGRVFRRSELLDKVWGYGHDGYEHTVNSHINRLRAKIENDPADPQQILTIWGVGYKFIPNG